VAEESAKVASIRLPGELARSAREILDGNQPPAVPRDAATVMLLRQRTAGLEVYMLRRKRTMVSLEALCSADGEEYAYEIPSGEPNPFDNYRSKEEARKVAEALMTLDPLHREVLVLRFHEELSLEEIATVTRAPLSTVKSRLYRGVAALKPKLDREGA